MPNNIVLKYTKQKLAILVVSDPCEQWRQAAFKSQLYRLLAL